MEQKLKDIQLILSGLMYSQDIEDIVFDNNGHKNCDTDKCQGKRVIDRYNSQVLNQNMNNLKQFGKKANLDNETFVIDDTKHFCIGWIKPRANDSVGYNIMTFYFKEIIIIETTQNCLQPIPPKYVAFRHCFKPDVLFFLKHFYKTQFTEKALEYVIQNPQYFKPNTMDTYVLIKKANDILVEIINQNITNKDNLDKILQKNSDLEIENQMLKNRIFQMELDKLSTKLG